VARKDPGIAAIEKEIHDIHLSNRLYWKLRTAPDAAATAEYQRRLDRLEEVRHKLAQLQLPE